MILKLSHVNKIKIIGIDWRYRRCFNLKIAFVCRRFVWNFFYQRFNVSQIVFNRRPIPILKANSFRRIFFARRRWTRSFFSSIFSDWMWRRCTRIWPKIRHCWWKVTHRTARRKARRSLRVREIILENGCWFDIDVIVVFLTICFCRTVSADG